MECNNTIYNVRKNQLLLGIDLEVLQDRINIYIKNVLKENLFKVKYDKEFNYFILWNFLNSNHIMFYVGKDKTNKYFVIPKESIKDLIKELKHEKIKLKKFW